MDKICKRVYLEQNCRKSSYTMQGIGYQNINNETEPDKSKTLECIQKIFLMVRYVETVDVMA